MTAPSVNVASTRRDRAASIQREGRGRVVRPVLGQPTEGEASRAKPLRYPGPALVAARPTRSAACPRRTPPLGDASLVGTAPGALASGGSFWTAA